MKLLFNHKFKVPATVLFYASLIVGLISLINDNDWENLWTVPVYSVFGSVKGGFLTSQRGWIENSIFNEVLTLLIICSGLLANFARERVEDELISKIRLESLALSILINYGLLLVANMIVFDLSFYYVLICYLFTPLVVFHIIFRYRLFNYYRA